MFNTNCHPKERFFTSFKEDVSRVSLPEKFTFPFYYEPHALCKIAATELQARLEKDIDWKHNFGFEAGHEEQPIGKMFGVLVVQNKEGQLGYLSAYSGKLTAMERPQGFVPHVYNLPSGYNFFLQGMDEINALGEEIRALEKSPELAEAKANLDEIKQQAAEAIERYREEIRQARKARRALRPQAEKDLSAIDFKHFMKEQVKESLHMRHQLRVLNATWQEKIEEKNSIFQPLQLKLDKLKEHRANKSADLQQRIFTEYQFLNQAGEYKSLHDIFTEVGLDQPPAGAGECAAPKLLHAAFESNFTPIAMAEFWWGASPKSEVRKHKQFYPACKSKCKPILGHMLEGIEVDANPMLINVGANKAIETLYEDEHLLVVNKPEGLLSVPGKSISDSVATRLKEKYPNATGPLVVHRLDQGTSGIILVAKTLEVHNELQKQFMKRSVKKRYVALLEGVLKTEKGVVDLPLRVDLDNRPYQLVCYDYGKRGITQYKKVRVENDKTRVHLYPFTGRTHQLRVHMAHQLGLNMPIVGDDLYGNKGERLYLHAEYLEFVHPVTEQTMRITAKAEF